MNLQSVSSPMSAGNYAKPGKSNGNGNNISLSPKSAQDKLIEKIQEQIIKIQENEHYDADTKKSKIEELQEQLKEIETANRMKESEELKAKSSKSEKTNSDGDILETSAEAQAIIEAGLNLDAIKNAYSMKKSLQGESNVLKSEIKMDKGRGVNTAKKEEVLSKLNAGVEAAAASMGKAVRDVNESASKAAEAEQPVEESSTEEVEPRQTPEDEI